MTGSKESCVDDTMFSSACFSSSEEEEDRVGEEAVWHAAAGMLG